MPDVKAVNILTRFKGVIKNGVNGFELYVEAASSLNGWLENIQQATGEVFFDFDIECSNPAFINFTDLPLGEIVKLAYNSSITENTGTGNSLKLVETFSSNSQPGQLGKLRVYFKDITLSTAGSYNKYIISFKARATQWQYYVINRSGELMDNPVITGTPDIPFQGPTAVLLENGQQALLFSSGNKLLPLSIQPLYAFSLFNKFTASEIGPEDKTTLKTIIKCLPTPGENIVTKNENGEVMVFSPMYVNV